LESFVTRNYDNLPDASKWTIIIGSFCLIGFLYVFLPIYQARRFPERLAGDPEFKQAHQEPIELLQVRTTWQVYRQGIMLFFSLFGILARPVFKVVMPLAVLFIVVRAYLFPSDLMFVYWFDWSSHLSFMLGYDLTTPIDIFGYILWIGIITYIFLLTYYHMLQKAGLYDQPWKVYFRQHVLKSFVLIGVLLSPILFSPWYILLPLLALYPFFLYLPTSIAFPLMTIRSGIKKGIKYGSRTFFGLLVLLVLAVGTIAAVFQPVSGVFSIQDKVPDLLDLVVKALSAFIEKAGFNGVFWTNLIREVVYLILLIISILFWSIILCLSYLSTLEKREALKLKQEGKLFGERHRLKEQTETSTT